MLFDYKILKSDAKNAYDLHQLVAATFKGESGRNLFCDYGDHIRVRSTKHTLRTIRRIYEVNIYKGLKHIWVVLKISNFCVC